jgi:class 3 adenylate cyclase
MVGEFGGRIIDTAGDGILSKFASAVSAVECTLAIQKTMAERNSAVEQARRMMFRIGVNVGDVISDGDRIYGDRINVAARLEGIAESGGICRSEARRAVESNPGFSISHALLAAPLARMGRIMARGRIAPVSDSRNGTSGRRIRWTLVGGPVARPQCLSLSGGYPKYGSPYCPSHIEVR